MSPQVSSTQPEGSRRTRLMLALYTVKSRGCSSGMRVTCRYRASRTPPCVTASTQLVEGLRKRMKAREFADAPALLRALRADLVAMLLPVAQPLQIDAGRKPFVILTVGVNGVGKTTTIGKLARRYKDEGRSLVLAAGGTFRAAAVAHHARTECRRAERAIVALALEESVNDAPRQYLNRFSDLLFVLGRVLNRAGGRGDVLWQKGKNA